MNTESDSEDTFPFPTLSYSDSLKIWPTSGRHILSHYTGSNIILYLSTPQNIARTVLLHQNFRYNHSYANIKWLLTPTFVSIVHFSYWASKFGQERILALTVTREGFEDILKEACSQFDTDQEVYHDNKDIFNLDLKSGYVGNGQASFEWIQGIKDPLEWENNLVNLEFLHLRLGKGALARFLFDSIVYIEDVTPFVRKQRHKVLSQDKYLAGNTIMNLPEEIPYRFKDESLVEKVGIDEIPTDKWTPPDEIESDVEDESDDYDDDRISIYSSYSESDGEGRGLEDPDVNEFKLPIFKEIL